MVKYILIKIMVVLLAIVVIINFGAGLFHPEGEIDLLWPQIIVYLLCPIGIIDVAFTSKAKGKEKETHLKTQMEFEQQKMELKQKDLNLQLREKELLIQELKRKRELITEEDIVIAKERRFCLVHRGNIDGYSYICPNCGALYCQKCFDAIKEIDNLCWSCGNPSDPSKPTPEPKVDEDISINKLDLAEVCCNL